MREKTIWDVEEMLKAERREMLEDDSVVVSLDSLRTHSYLMYSFCNCRLILLSGEQQLVSGFFICVISWENRLIYIIYEIESTTPCMK